MALLALACAVLGLGAFRVVPALAVVPVGLGGLRSGPELAAGGFTLGVAGAYGTMSPLVLAVGLAALLALVPIGLRVFRAARGLRVGDTWGCGRIEQSPRMQYTATAFAEPLRRVFAELYRPAEDLSVDFHPGSRYFVQSIAYRTRILPWFERYLYEPVIAWVRLGATRARAVQSGSVHAYLAYLVGALVVLLGFLMAWGD
jgi:hypothetical protein